MNTQTHTEMTTVYKDKTPEPSGIVVIARAAYVLKQLNSFSAKTTLVHTFQVVSAYTSLHIKTESHVILLLCHRKQAHFFSARRILELWACHRTIRMPNRQSRTYTLQMPVWKSTSLEEEIHHFSLNRSNEKRKRQLALCRHQ